MGLPEPLSFGSFLPNGVEGKEKFQKCSQPGIFSTQGESRTCQRSVLRGKPWITSHPIHCCFWLAISGSPDAETLLESNSSFLTSSYSPPPSLQKTTPCSCLLLPALAQELSEVLPRGPEGSGSGSGLLQSSSVAQSCPTLCDPVNHSTPGLPVHHQLPESTQAPARRQRQNCSSLYFLGTKVLLVPIFDARKRGGVGSEERKRTSKKADWK